MAIFAGSTPKSEIRDPNSAMTRDRALGALLGAAGGDALGMPVDGLSHQNVRLYYKGGRGHTADEERRDLGAGPGTAHTRHLRALTRLLSDAGPAADRQRSERFVNGLERQLEGTALRRAAPAPWGERAAASACAVPFGIWSWARGSSDEDVATLIRIAMQPHDVRGPAL